MKDSQELPSPVYQSLRRLRYILPITAFLLVVIHQALAYTWLRSTPGLQQFLWQVLLYGTIGPVVVWFALNWFARWVHERDEAETHLHCLYQISRQAASATEMETLVEIALRMPEQIIRPVATSLILREHSEGPWMLAGTRGLQAKEEEMLAARLTIAGSDLYCGQCAALSATTQQNCPLQFHLPQADMWPTATSVICLPLSTERLPLALLNVYVLNEEALSPSMRRVLESMAAVLSVALDHARLRAREFQMLHRMEQAARQRESLTATLERILADIATAHRAQAGEVFLASKEGEEPTLIPIASWPGKETNPHLVSPARRAFLEEDSVIVTSSQSKEYMVAVPLMAENLTTGVLVLAGRRPFTPSLAAFLRVAAGMMALIIRNNQLYTKLESQAVLEERNRLAREVHDGLAQSLGFLNFKLQQVDRLLACEQQGAARQALQEMREGIQDLYTEVRLTIQDLRWVPEDGQRLAERLRQYVLDFGDRTGLDISLDTEGEPILSLQEEIHLFRIVQEALANVHKHARAQRAWVRLQAGPEGTCLEVEDDGTGMSSETYPPDPLLSDVPEHFGLRIMQERAEAIGGRLSLHSVPGQGTRLQVLVTAQQVPASYLLSPSPEGK